MQMTGPHERLKQARAKLFSEAKEAAEAMGIKDSTYFGHENGHRGITRKTAAKYAKRFKVNVEWLLYATGPRDRKASALDEADDFDVEEQELLTIFIQTLKARRKRRTA